MKQLRLPIFLAALAYLPSCGKKEEKLAAVKATTEPSAPSTDETFARRLGQELERIDPDVDGWNTEEFGETASGRLKELGAMIEKIGTTTPGSIAKLFAPEVSLSSLCPSGEVTYDRNNFTVRSVAPAQLTPPVPANHAAILAAISQLAAPLHATGHPHTKFKIIRVTPAESSVSTRVLALLDGHNDGGESIQINAHWEIRWTNAEVPMITGLNLLTWEEITSKVPGNPLFTDCTSAALPSQGEVSEQLSRGLPHWIRAFDKDTGVSTNGYNGISVGDLDGDGLDDLYICQTGGIPNRILLRNADGTLRDHSSASGANFLNDTRCALIVDLDNDGNNDLVLNIPNGVVLMQNTGNAVFTKRAEFPATGSPFGLSAADPDEDGLLDLYICGYGAVWGGLGDYKHHIPVPMHDANNGGRNLFFRNLGGWKFEDQTIASGLEHNNTRWSLSSAWEDFDNDGDLDLYVANDFGRKNLYRNESSPGGALKFTDVAAAWGAEDLSPGMSASWGDVNNDGRPDIYVSNMFSGAGNRITTQAQFLPAATQQTRANFLRMSRGNTLLLGGNEKFEDVSEASGVTVGRWAWASGMVDVNNDGWQDILVANGFMTGEDPADL